MKKKKYIIILSIFIIVLIVLFAIVNNNEAFKFTNNLFFGKRSTNKTNEENFNDIDTIYIDVDNAIINISNSQTDSINVQIFSNRDNVNLKSYNNKLSIITENKMKCLFCKMNVINIKAPSNFKEYININNDYGHVSISKFPLASISILNKFGNISVEEANVLKVVANRGDIDIGTSSRVSINNGWGDIKIISLENATVKGKLSNVKINEINKSINLNVDYGDIDIDSIVVDKDSTISVKYGDVKVDNIKEEFGSLLIRD